MGTRITHHLRWQTGRGTGGSELEIYLFGISYLINLV